jgi:3-dehydro-4-phosphotetronate decarboxylase
MIQRDRICAVGASLYRRGYTVGSAGNISVRLDDGWLITPTDACLGALQPDRIAKVDLQGQWMSGDKPSKTLSLHQHIYRAQPQAQSVLHTHSTHLVALSLAGVWRPECIVPPLTPYYVMKVGQVPLISYRKPGDPQIAREVGERAQAAQHLRAVMLERLGPIVWHASIEQASAALEELEETAKLYWMMRLSNQVVEPLNDDAIVELCQTFNVRW